MASTSLDYTYDYPFHSILQAAAAGPLLELATSKQMDDYPYFFTGRLLQPRTTALFLFLLSKIVGTRFYTPPAMVNKQIALADPVITSGGGLLRFEGFSACCSVYARLDLNPDGYAGEIIGNGTTNVDFNAPMRAALCSVRELDKLSMSVGADHVKLEQNDREVVERKVKLPVRWIKGFVEVQAYQAQMDQKLSIGKAETIKFLRSVPANAHYKSTFWVVPSGGGLRLTQTASHSGVKVGGLERIAILKQMAPMADSLKIYASPNGESSEWRLEGRGMSFCMTLSADSSRGFSGEGQVLTDLAETTAEKLAAVRASLAWQSQIDLYETAKQFDLTPQAVRKILAVLGSRGLVGFDLQNGKYFARQMPFDMEMVDSIHPRLLAAQKLNSDGDVKIDKKNGTAIEARVKGTDVQHIVRLDEEISYCTCQWHSKYQGLRGPCKHILAARIFNGEDFSQDV